ncbi:MAG: glycosyl hydrolase [Candidatus Eisenbacteria bacterium]|nr:glycosyl hydrolase [Candidatus Eisenbacteria bacterium]
MPGSSEGQEQSGVPSAARSKPISQRAGDALAPKSPNPWFFLERAYPFGRIPHDVWVEAQIEARRLRDEARAFGKDRGTWTFRGPTNIAGRVTDLAVHPSNPAIVYMGAAEGGVLRTTDSGQHWTPLFDEESCISVGAVALDPLTPATVYAGTGEVNPGGGSVAYGGSGIFRSTDSGDTWQGIGLEGSGSIGRIRIDPTDPRRMYVAAMGNLWSTSEERGVFRTTDGGTTWERVLFVSDSTGAVDLILRPDQPRTIFAAMWERIRRPRAYHYGGITCGVYRSTDGGDTWAPVSGGLPAPSTNRGRIGLAICESQPNVMCAVYADKTGYYDGLYRTTDGGATWTRANDGALSGVFASYGWWFGNVRIDPADPNKIFVLGLDFYRSTNGGTSWSETSGGMHVDHHALAFGPVPNPVIYEGNDGGVYRSTNGGSAWTLLPDQPITQIYRVALDPSHPGALYAGAQDNGTLRTLSGGLNDWQMIYGGDGFQPLVHPQNGNRIWAQYQYGSLSYSSNGGGYWVGATNGISYNDRHNWNTPVAFDRSDPNRMFYGTQKVYRSTNGTSWTAISGDLTGGAGGGSQGNVYGTVTTIESSPLDGNVVWAGSDDGHVSVTTNGGGAWTDVSGALPDRWITSVRTSPHARDTAYVTISGFRWNEPLPHVFRTTDLGANWSPIASNLPEAPANDLVVDPADPQRLFVATDVGVFETLDGGANWVMLGGDLPNVVVTCLAFEAVERVLVAGTYGRSFFSYDVDQPSAVPETLAGGGAGAGAGALQLRLSPNPASDRVAFAWTGAAGSQSGGVVEVFTVSGRRVWRGEAPVGTGQLPTWNLRDESGNRVAAGAYYARVREAGPVGRTATAVLTVVSP